MERGTFEPLKAPSGEAVSTVVAAHAKRSAKILAIIVAVEAGYWRVMRAAAVSLVEAAGGAAVGGAVLKAASS